MLTKGNKLYVRIDKKVKGKRATNQDYDDHMAFVEALAKERYFVGGNFSGVDAGMVLLSAESLNEAQSIISKDPIIERGLYQFELYEWNLIVLSDIIDT